MKIKFEPIAIEMEKQGRWPEVLDYLLLQWQSDKYNCNKLLCALLEMWYFFCFDWDIIDHDYENYGYLSSTYLNHYMPLYLDATIFGFKHFGDRADFLALMGYSIAIKSWLFSNKSVVKAMNLPEDCSCESLEKGGLRMIEEAHALSPEDQEIAAIYRQCHGLNLDSNLNMEGVFQWGDGAVSEYYRNIFVGSA